MQKAKFERDAYPGLGLTSVILLLSLAKPFASVSFSFLIYGTEQ